MMVPSGVQTRRARQEQGRLLAAREHAAGSGPFVRLSEDLLFAVLSFCDGATLGRLERTCRLFGLAQKLQAADALAQSLPERAAAFQMDRLGLSAPSLWAQSTGASCKHQLWRTACPAARVRRFPVRIPFSGGSPAFGPRGELWMADYMSKCVKQVGWKATLAGGRFTVTKTFRLPASMRSTAAGVAVSSDGLRLAVTVQPPYYQDGPGSHGFIVMCARTGAALASFLDGGVPGGDEDELEYPSAVEWLRGGRYAGHLAIADYNNGRVQIRNPETGALEWSVALEGNCVSGVAELAGDTMAVVPHASDAVAVFDVREIAQNYLSPTPRWLGRNECGMPIAASGVDAGQTLAVSDGAHRCVLFFEQAASPAGIAGRHARSSRAKGSVSVAVDYCSGEIVEKQDRARPREFGRRPPQQWRRLRVDGAEHVGGESSDDEDFSVASFHGDDTNDSDSGDADSGDEGDEEEDGAQEHADAESEQGSDSEEDTTSPWGPFGIWTSLGFDHKRGDMAVSDSGTRYSDEGVWLS